MGFENNILSGLGQEAIPPPQVTTQEADDGTGEESSFGAEILKSLGRAGRFPADVLGAVLGEDNVPMQEGPSLRGFLKESQESIAPKGTFAQQIVGGITENVARQGLILALTKGNKNASLAIQSFGAGVLKYRELKDEGVDTPEALGVAAAVTVLEGVTEKVPLEELFRGKIPVGKLLKSFKAGEITAKELKKAVSGGFLKRIIRTTVADLIGEEAAEFGGIGAEAAILGRDLPTFEEAVDIGLSTALVSIGSSVPMATTAEIIHRNKGTKTPKVPPPKSEVGAELVVEEDRNTPSPTTEIEDLTLPGPVTSENDHGHPTVSEGANVERAQQGVVSDDAAMNEATKGYNELVEEGIVQERTNKDIGSIISKIMFPHTIAKKFKKFKEIYDIGLKFVAKVDRRVSGYAESLTPYLELSKAQKKNVDAILIEERIDRDDTALTMEEKLLRLSPQEIQAHTAYRATMLKAKDDIANHLIEMGNDPQTVVDFVNRLPATYVPLKRVGDHFVAVRDRTGEVVHYSHHKSVKEMRAEAVKHDGEGKIFTGKVKQTSDEVVNEIPVNLLALISQVDKKIGVEVPRVYSEILKFGFPTHLVQTKKTTGFETDLSKPTADYLMGLSKWMSRRESRGDFAKSLSKIDPTTEANLFTNAKKYADYVTGSTNEFSKFRQFLFRFYLGGNIKSAMLNATQTLTTTAPTMVKYAGFRDSGKSITSAMAKAGQSLDTISKTDPQLADALKQAIFDGVVSEQFVTMLRGEAYQGIDMSRLDSVLSFFFNHVEVYNRKVAFIAAYEQATKRGVNIKDVDGKKRKVKLSHEEAIEFGESFIRETQFEYSKADRPAIARGKAAPFFTFRIFAGNYLSMLKGFLGEREFKALATSLAVMIGMGGVAAVPGIKELEKALEIAGYDPKKILKDKAGKWGDFLMHGMAFPAGVDISGALGTVNMVPDGVQQGAWPAVANIVLGVPTDLPKRISRAIFFAKDMRDPWRAVEAIMPEAVRNPMVAARWAREGAARTPFGEPIAKPKLGDIILKALSIQPALLTRAYEREHSERLLSDRSRKASKNMAFFIARSLFKEDGEETQRLLMEISENNVNAENPSDLIILDKQSIKEALANMMYPEAVELKRAPRKTRREFLDIQETFKEE